MGIIRQKQKFVKGSSTASLSVGALPNDIYTLRIFDGKVWQTCKIMIHK
jgi:hypothetical protein